MGSLGNPKTWVPYMNTKDCSQGFCSLYCPQWCYIIFPPPPPYEFPEDNSGPNFSPLVIAIIGILASAFLLVSYYAIVSRYCGNTDSARRENHDPHVELEENRDPSNHESWHAATNGLDEALIKSIAVCKYQKGDGLIEGTDCSVCLGEFQEDESLRLLPKCTHAFHVKCIDTWLRSHSNCPLCRANVGFVNAFPVQFPPPEIETRLNIEPLSQNNEEIDNVVALEAIETAIGEREMSSMEGDSIMEIRDDEDQWIRRSVSMDFSRQRRVSISDMLRIDQDGELQMGMSKCSHRSRVLHCVMSPVSMKRSFSSGRFSFGRRGRGRNNVIPL